VGSSRSARTPPFGTADHSTSSHSSTWAVAQCCKARTSPRQQPLDISDAYLRSSFRRGTGDMVARLLGPDIKFHHCNDQPEAPGCQRPRSPTTRTLPTRRTPTTMSSPRCWSLDDIDDSNGCLPVCRGSHNGPMPVRCFAGERFTGGVCHRRQKSSMPLWAAPKRCLMIDPPASRRNRCQHRFHPRNTPRPGLRRSPVHPPERHLLEFLHKTIPALFNRMFIGPTRPR